MGCKNNQMYLFWTVDSHFVGSSFWFLFNKFIPNGIRPADNNFVTPSHQAEPGRNPRSWFSLLFCQFTRVYGRVSFCQRFARRGWRNRCHPDFFQYSWGFPGFLGPIFQNRPTVDVQPPKEQKQHKTAFLLLHRKAVFSFFRRRQRNDFRLSVRVVLGFDRGRRRWGLTGSRDGRKDWGAILFFNRNRHFPFFPI